MKNKNIALIAPSKGTTKEKLDLAISRLNKLGFHNIFYRENILDKVANYWSGSIEERASEINEYFSNSDIDIIWCVSGGYSSLELLPHLDYNKISKNKKIFIGYSDITSLSIGLLQKSKVKTIQFHMPGTMNWINSKKESELFFKALKEKEYSIKLKKYQIHCEGKAEGELIGGCLSIICSTIGTDFEINTDGKILYLEDNNSAPAKLYSDLCHLELAGKLKGIKGIIISKIHNSREYLPILEKFLDKLKNKNIPIIKELDSGHNEFKTPITIGGKCKIDTKNKNISYL